MGSSPEPPPDLNHRTVRLEGTAVGHPVQPPCLSLVTLEHTAQGCIRAVLEYLQSRRESSLGREALHIRSVPG